MSLSDPFVVNIILPGAAFTLLLAAWVYVTAKLKDPLFIMRAVMVRLHLYLHRFKWTPRAKRLAVLAALIYCVYFGMAGYTGWHAYFTATKYVINDAGQKVLWQQP